MMAIRFQPGVSKGHLLRKEALQILPSKGGIGTRLKILSMILIQMRPRSFSRGMTKEAAIMTDQDNQLGEEGTTARSITWARPMTPRAYPGEGF
jgi:hypothetical protein